MRQITAVADDEHRFASQFGDDLRRRAEAPDELDAPVGQRRGRFLETFEHESEVPEIRIGIIGVQAEPAQHGLAKLVGATDSVFERRVMGLSLALLHPVEDIPTVLVDR